MSSASGSTTFSVTPGFTGTLDASVVRDGRGDADRRQGHDRRRSTSTTRWRTGGHEGLRRDACRPAPRRPGSASTADDNTADLDLFVYDEDGEFVGPVGLGRGGRAGDAPRPGGGRRTDVYVNGFATPGGSTSYHLSNCVVPSADAGNLTVTDAAVMTGVPVTLTASWSGLDPAKRWLGVISYADATDVTFITVG